MNRQFPGTDAVIEAFARLETEPARTVVNELNARFAKAMGLKLENTAAEDRPMPDVVIMMAGIFLPGALRAINPN